MTTDLEEARARRRWPRVIATVARHVGDARLAARYVRKAALGEALYVRIVREAFSRRHGIRRIA